MRNLAAKELKIRFIEILNDLGEFSYEDGNPFFVKIGAKQYCIYLKNLSPAYFKNSPDIVRVQLPYSEHFLKIFNVEVLFIIFGYDVETDTVVTWNPRIIRERLNSKRNVSLYSRYSLHELVTLNELKSGYLSNGEKIVLFKRKNLNLFFKFHQELFEDNTSCYSKGIEIIRVEEPDQRIVECNILELMDYDLLQKLYPLLQKNQVLQAVEITSRHYSGKFKNMTFKDWYKIVDAVFKDLSG